MFGQTGAKVGAMAQGRGSDGGKRSCDPLGLRVRAAPAACEQQQLHMQPWDLSGGISGLLLFPAAQSFCFL